jgi:hypothetical protein
MGLQIQSQLAPSHDMITGRWRLLCSRFDFWNNAQSWRVRISAADVKKGHLCWEARKLPHLALTF